VRDSKKFGGRNAENDSLDYFFEQANIDTLPYPKRLHFTEKALAIVEKQPNDSINRVNYFKVANRYYNIRCFEKYKTTIDIILQKSTLSNDVLSVSKAYGYFGDYYRQKTLIDSAYKNYFKAEKLATSLPFNVYFIKILIAKSSMLSDQNDYIGSEKSLFRALVILKRINKNELNTNLYTYDVYKALGDLYSDLKEYKKAFTYYDKAMLLEKQNNFPTFYYSKATLLNNIGATYEEKKMYNEAISFFKRALLENNLKNDKPILYVSIKTNLAISKSKIFNFVDLPQELNETLKISESINDIQSLIHCELSIANYYLSQNNLIKAESFSAKAYSKASDHKLYKLKLNALNELILANPKNASKNASEYYNLTDSLDLAERRNRNKFARIEYETEELAQEKNQLIAQKHNYNLTAMIISLTIITTSLFGFIIFQRRRIKLKQQKQKATAEIYRLQLDQQQKVEDGKQLEKRESRKNYTTASWGNLPASG